MPTSNEINKDIMEGWMTYSLNAFRTMLGSLLIIIMLGASTRTNAQEVIPDFYREAGLSLNRDYADQHFGEKIDPFTGALQLSYVDLRLPGNGGFDLDVVRSYNSAASSETNPALWKGEAGIGWTIHFGRILNKQSLLPCTSNAFGATVFNNPVLELPDGSRQILVYAGTVAPLTVTTRRWKADCSPGGLGMVVYSPDGVRYDMTQLVNVSSGTLSQFAWYTTKITDRNNNAATITYKANASPEIISIATTDQRLITFTYLDSGLASRRISTISAHGAKYTYGYTAVAGVAGQYFLTSVTRPDSVAWGYAYSGALVSTAGSYALKKLTYPQGGSILYTYGWINFDNTTLTGTRSTVVKTKSTSDGGTWSYIYTPGAAGVYDTTTSTGPEGTTKWVHIGPNFAASGSVWMVGLLVRKDIGSIQSESYAWVRQKLSSQNNLRPGAFLAVDIGEYSAPLLSSRTIVRDGGTHTTTYSVFDAYGNPGSIAEAGPNGTRSTAQSFYINTTKWIVNQIRNQTISGGVALARTFDANGNLSSIARDGVTTTYARTPSGDISSATMPRALVHTFAFHKRGIPQSESQPEGVAITRTIDDRGNETSITDGELHTTLSTYDGLNRTTAITFPVGAPLTIAYTATNKVATRGTLVQSTSIDGFGRITSVTIGGIASTYRYDTVGRRIFVSNPGSTLGTTYGGFDVLNRARTITNADGTLNSKTYGAGTVSTTNERGFATTYGYRSFGSPDEKYLLTINRPIPAANATITRNGRQQVASIAQGGITRSYGYDSRGFLTSVVNPETGTTLYARDAAGNMTSRSVGGSASTTYTYDGQNRLTSEIYPGTTGSVTKTYTRTGKLKSAGSTSATVTYSYDPNDNLITSLASIDGSGFATSFGYNTLDQLTSIAYPQTGSVVSYTPDALGRPTSIPGFITSVGYWPSGQVSSLAYANGVVTNYSQNARLWPGGAATTFGAGVYQNLAYGYDGNGNITTAIDTADPTYSRTLGYDALDRLSTAAGPWGGGSYVYSGTGNMQSQTLGATIWSYAYDASNRLSGVSGGRVGGFTYDLYGNTTSAFGMSLGYDDASNLICANCNGAANQVLYQYDGLGRRISITKSGTKSYEIYDPSGKLLLEYDPSTRIATEYIYLGNQRVAQRVVPPRRTGINPPRCSTNPLLCA